jgi:hypothetical protein
MSTFLSQIIGKILGDGSVPLHDVAVVLPNRRARRLLLQGLSSANGHKTMFAPQIFPMEEFVAWLSPLKVIDQVTQLLRLQSITRDFQGEYFELHNLLSWGTAFLKDISDMDMQLQDVPTILKEYAKAAAFEIPFGKEEMSETDREKIFFNELLGEIYEKYCTLLKQNKEAYEGMIYRDCAENMSEYAPKLPYKLIVFAGFYALSPSELEIIRYLQAHFRTEIYFDIDPFYCHLDEAATRENPSQCETSFFIHRNCEKLHLNPIELSFNEPNFASIPKTVQIVATSGNMRQIYSAIREVERIKERKKAEFGAKSGIVDMSDTAVVLADENLLLPFLLSYNTEDVVINATMGFPFEATPVYSLLLQLLAVYESVFALTADDATELSFSGELVEQLWNHELLRTVKPASQYFPTVMRCGQLPNSELFAGIAKTSLSRQLPTVLNRFCQFVESVTVEPRYQQLWQEVNRKLFELQLLFDSYFAEDEVIDYPFARFSVVKWLHDVSISIQGDPDTGLQVMGLLETRMMDFQNVIMLSVNEGVLPKGITYNSLLPFDFKFKFDGQDALPNYLYQDQVYAYHFFRLLQRAEDVTLLYNNASDVNLAEKSRFIAQLEYEVISQKIEDKVVIMHQNLDFDLSLPLPKTLSIPKTEEVIAQLRRFKFSASSLQTFISCPLKFYFRYLMNIKATPVLGDYLEASELGTVIHALFKNAFDNITRESDVSNYANVLQKHIDACDDNICLQIKSLKNRESLTQSDLEQGHWLLNRRIISEMVKRYLEVAKIELTTQDWKITDNELEVNISDYQVAPVDGTLAFPVRLTGSLDRVQKIGDEVMILDYKTGKVEESHLRISLKKELQKDESAVRSALDAIFTDSKYDKLFQLVFYSFMYEHFAGTPASLQVGIISTREVNKNNPCYLLRGKILDDYNILAHKKMLSERLNLLFCDIFDAKQPFNQTDDNEKCRICDFLHLCGRQTATENR